MLGNELDDGSLAYRLGGHLSALSIRSSAKGLTRQECIIMHSGVNNIPVGVLGASGYAGRELCSLLQQHPTFKLAFATANNQRGEAFGVGSRRIEFIDSESADMSAVALVFSALPHGASAEWVGRAAKSGARVVDLSSDLRPGNGASGIPYGMPELSREGIRSAEIVANPGC